MNILVHARKFAFLLLAIPVPSGAADLCSYASTNQLVWDKQFRAALNKFFGSEKLDLFIPSATISEQVVEGLGGLPNPIVKKHDLLLASACRAHSCDEKSAVVIQCPATLVAAGVLHYHCTKAGCDSTPTATLFIGDVNDDGQAKAELRAWAQQVNAQAIIYRTPSNLPVHTDFAPAALRR